MNSFLKLSAADCFLLLLFVVTVALGAKWDRCESADIRLAWSARS
jgi:hypothetical protein